MIRYLRQLFTCFSFVALLTQCGPKDQADSQLTNLATVGGHFLIDSTNRVKGGEGDYTLSEDGKIRTTGSVKVKISGSVETRSLDKEITVSPSLLVSDAYRTPGTVIDFAPSAFKVVVENVQDNKATLRVLKLGDASIELSEIIVDLSKSLVRFESINIKAFILGAGTYHFRTVSIVHHD